LAARLAHVRYESTGHGAALNHGDCFACALAKAMDAPLMCNGSDFPATDIRVA
jgi:ribonuclease VapC